MSKRTRFRPMSGGGRVPGSRTGNQESARPDRSPIARLVHRRRQSEGQWGGESRKRDRKKDGKKGKRKGIRSRRRKEKEKEKNKPKPRAQSAMKPAPLGASPPQKKNAGLGSVGRGAKGAEGLFNKTSEKNYNGAFLLRRSGARAGRDETVGPVPTGVSISPRPVGARPSDIRTVPHAFTLFFDSRRPRGCGTGRPARRFGVHDPVSADLAVFLPAFH